MCVVFSLDTSDLASRPVFTWRPPASISREPRSPARQLNALRRARHVLVRHLRLRDAASQGRSFAAQRFIGVSPSAAAAPSLATFYVLLFVTSQWSWSVFVTMLTEYDFVRLKIKLYILSSKAIWCLKNKLLPFQF